MSKELKSCPFCNGKAKIYWQIGEYRKTLYYIGCTNCKCTVGGQYGFDAERKAIEQWNNRA